MNKALKAFLEGRRPAKDTGRRTKKCLEEER
jgi:hypothetical protein